MNAVRQAAPAAGAALAQAAARLAALDVPRLDVELLLAHVLNLPRAGLFMQSETALSPAQTAQFQTLLQRRLDGEPVAYLIGEWEFWSLPLKVTPAVLIPRPETELLVEWCLELLPAGAASQAADLGTGSGAIALALAHERPHAQILAVDISPAALSIAGENARLLKLPNVELLRADFSGALDGRPPFDLIASNPPYVAAGDSHLAALRHEPLLALASGADGLDALRSIVSHAYNALRSGGWLLLEHGHEQGAAVRQLLSAAGYIEIQTRRDLEGRERATGGRRP